MGAFAAAIDRIPFLHYLAKLGRSGMNPMMFKELSQGVRNKGFLGLFFLLILSGLIVVMLVPLLAAESYGGGPAPGLASFACLIGCLHLYGMAMGVRMLTLTFKEVENKTFDLYALSGMSPEKMVLGKLLTTCYTYFFGVCCLAPFMFASYFMRGLDFRVIFAGLAVDASLNLVYFFGCVLVGMARAYAKHKIMLLAFSLGLGFGMFGLGLAIFIMLLDGGISSDPFKLFVLLGFEDTLWNAHNASMAAIHASFLFLSFYWACHVVCPETDSREHMIKLPMLVVYAIGACVFQSLDSSNNGYLSGAFFLWYLLLGFGWFFWINREDVPIIPRNHLARLGSFKRAALSLCEPGRRGSARCLVAMALINAGALYVFQFTSFPSSFLGHPTRSGSSYDPAAISLSLALPLLGIFMLAAWDAALGMFRGLQRNYALRRSALLLTWGLVAVSAIFIISVLFSQSNLEEHPATVVLGLFATPILTPWALDQLFDSTPGMLLAGVLGVAGLAILYMDSRRIAADSAARRSDLGRDLFDAIGRGEVAAEAPSPADAARRAAQALAASTEPAEATPPAAPLQAAPLQAASSESPSGGG